MPVYNVENWLKKAIESVLNQTYKNLELLLIDDGSTDNSGAICDYYARNDNRVRVFHKRNEGLSVARNIGLNEAKGEWIAFLDSDDWIDSHMYEVLLQTAIQNNAKLVACKTEYFYEDEPVVKNTDTSIIVTYTISEVLKKLLNNNNVRFEVWNKLWDKNIIGDTRFKKGQVSEDVYFDFEIFKKVMSVTFIDTSLHHYLVKRKGNTNSKFRIERMCIFDEFESYINYLKQQDKSMDASVVACIASMFCISVFLEAKQKRQSEELCLRLRKLFFHFVRLAGKGVRYKFKAVLLFALSPKLYQYILEKKLSYLRAEVQ